MNADDWKLFLEYGTLPATQEKRAEVMKRAPSVDAGGVIHNRRELGLLLREVYPGTANIDALVVRLMQTWLQPGRVFFSPQPYGAQIAWLRWRLFADDAIGNATESQRLLSAIVSGNKITTALRVTDLFLWGEMCRSHVYQKKRSR
jgi:hypothetical protein